MALMNCPPSLLFRITPHPLESGRGFLLRVSHDLGLDGVTVVAHLSGTSFHSLYNDDAFEKLAHWLRIYDIGLMRRHFYAPVGSTNRKGLRHFLDTQVSLKYLASYSSKVCPQCLAEERFHRAIWDLTYVVACPYHRCLLLDRCPSCHKKLSAKRQGPHLCSCGYDLRSELVVPAEHAALRLTRLIYRAAGDWSGTSDFEETYPPEVLSLDLNGILNVIHCFSSRLHSPGEKLKEAVRRNIEIPTAASSLAFADRLLSTWPVGFHAVLAEINQAYKVPIENKSVKGAFGLLYRFLHTRESLGELDFVRDAFRSFLAENWDGLPRWHNRWLRKGTTPSTKWMTVTQAAAKSNGVVDRQCFRRLVRNGVLKGKFANSEGDKRRNQLWIEQKSFDAWMANAGQWVSTPAAAEMLGLVRDGVFELSRAAVLKSSEDVLPGCQLSGVKVLKADIDQILYAFDQYELPVISRQKMPDGLVSLRDAIRDHIGLRGLSSAVKSVMSGSLRPMALVDGRDGLYRYCFSKAELIRLCRKIDGLEGSSMNNLQVAKRLNTRPDIVTALVRAGVIPSLGIRGKEMLYDSAAIDNFAQQYISSTEIAKAKGTSAAKVIRELGSVAPHAIHVMDAARKKVVFMLRDSVPSAVVPQPSDVSSVFA